MTDASNSTWQRCLETVDYLKAVVTPWVEPQLGIVLGSGLGKFGKRIENPTVVAYRDIPHFHPATVKGHAGNLIFGQVGGRQVVCQQGRYHYYEGHPISETIFPIRVMHGLGVKSLLVANAAGGIRESFKVGDIMVIRDHINFQGTNPLMGSNDERFGPRFPDMSYPYDSAFADAVHECANDMGLSLQDGVYISVTGPSYETPAEIRCFRIWGADAVGMSTVNEVIAANHCGMRVLGLSCIANAASGMDSQRLAHEDVAAVIDKMSMQFETLVLRWIEGL